MKTVFLTGGGGAAVPGLIKILKDKGYRVLAGDMESLSVGLYMADKAFQLPKGLSAEFLPTMRKICKKENVDAVIPLVDEELLAAIELENDHIPVLLPEKRFISMCLDKYELMVNLKKEGISIPKTRLASEGIGDFQYPVIAKPRVGRGSRGVELLSSNTDFNNYMQNINESHSIILQEYINGKEFTVSVIVWRDGNVQGVVPKEIIKKDGVTKIAVTRYSEKIVEACLKVQECLKANGPFNVQLRFDEGGEPYIFEINPRFSTSISLTIASGIDELNLILDQALQISENESNTKFKEGTVLLRQTMDNFINEEEFYGRYREILDEVD